MNIAIFGGSFDPPHLGHEALVYKALETLDISKVVIVPTFLNPFKSSSHFSPHERFELIDELFKDDTHIDVCDFELKQNRPTPSIETVKHLKELYNPNKIYLLMGADNLEKLHLWNNYEALNELVEFIVFHREGYEVKNDIITFKDIILNVDVSSTQLRDRLQLELIPDKIKHKVQNIWKKESKE